MSLPLDDLPRDPDWLVQHLRQMAEVVARQNASLASLRAEHDTVLAERDAARTERDLVREQHDVAQAEIEKLRLLIRQLQRGQFGRHSEKLDPDQLQLGLEDLEQAAAAAEAAQDGMAARNSTPRAPRVRRRNLGPCRRTCRGSSCCSMSRTRAAPAAAGPCTSSARTRARCSTSSRPSCG